MEEKSLLQKYNPVGHIVFTVMKQKNMGVGALLNSCFFFIYLSWEPSSQNGASYIQGEPSLLLKFSGSNLTDIL